jgi:hypothetical protein
VWYEFDGYVRLSAGLWEDLNTYAVYTAYVRPNNAFGTVQEIAFGVGYNDGKLLGPFALNPTALIALELSGQADAGTDKGVFRPDRHRSRLHVFSRFRVPTGRLHPALGGPEPERLL